MEQTPRTDRAYADALSALDGDHAFALGQMHAFAECLERELSEVTRERNEGALASRLIDAWCVDKGRQIPWAKAIQIVAIVTKQPDAERDRLLHLGDEDGSCEMCGRNAVAAERELEALRGKLDGIAVEFERRSARDKALAESQSGTVGFAVTGSFAACYLDAAKFVRAALATPPEK